MTRDRAKKQQIKNTLKKKKKAREKDVVMTELKVSPENSHVEAVIPSVAVFGNGASKEVIKARCSHKGKALIWQD